MDAANGCLTSLWRLFFGAERAFGGAWFLSDPVSEPKPEKENKHGVERQAGKRCIQAARVDGKVQIQQLWQAKAVHINMMTRNNWSFSSAKISEILWDHPSVLWRWRYFLGLAGLVNRASQIWWSLSSDINKADYLFTLCVLDVICCKALDIPGADDNVWRNSRVSICRSFCSSNSTCGLADCVKSWFGETIACWDNALCE